MNRDEKRTRASALPPGIIDVEGVRALFPRERTGGTWIAANDSGVCLALINWHRIEREPMGEILSRGEIVRALSGKSSSDEIASSIIKLPLSRMRPFRLIAISTREQIVIEWQWNLKRLAKRKRKWQTQHWFSSGFDEARAQRERTKVCASVAAGDGDAGGGKPRAGVNAAGYSLALLRRLHQSHAPERGPFSICMHRDDAATVSYTEVAVTPTRLTMRYKDTAPCLAGSTAVTSLSLRR